MNDLKGLESEMNRSVHKQIQNPAIYRFQQNKHVTGPMISQVLFS